MTTPRPDTNATIPTISKIRPIVLMLKPDVVTVTAKSRIAPRTMRISPNTMSPVPVPLFMEASFLPCSKGHSPRPPPGNRPIQDQIDDDIRVLQRHSLVGGGGFEPPTSS